jgi:inositol phosphorylceramide mannosyltransferase catalytic subunit
MIDDQANKEAIKWYVCHRLYANNYLLRRDEDYTVLPKRIHQIWLGSPLPEQYKQWTESWQKFNPGWEYKLWTDDNVDEVEIERRDLFNSITHLGQKSDFLRYHILNQYGGLYVDTDFECLKSFDDLTYLNFFTGRSHSKEVMELFIGLIASTPNHPILRKVLFNMNTIKSGNWKDIFNTTGTYFFTKMFFESVVSYSRGIVIFPPEYFYPFPNHNHEKETNPKRFIQDCSYAIHYWEVSWSSKNKQYVSK